MGGQDISQFFRLAALPFGVEGGPQHACLQHELLHRSPAIHALSRRARPILLMPTAAKQVLPSGMAAVAAQIDRGLLMDVDALLAVEAVQARGRPAVLVALEGMPVRGQGLQFGSRSQQMQCGAAGSAAATLSLSSRDRAMPCMTCYA